MIREKAVSGLDGLAGKAAQKLRSDEHHVPRESGGTQIQVAVTASQLY